MFLAIRIGTEASGDIDRVLFRVTKSKNQSYRYNFVLQELPNFLTRDLVNLNNTLHCIDIAYAGCLTVRPSPKRNALIIDYESLNMTNR